MFQHVFIFILFFMYFICCDGVMNSGWQRCLEKCYYFGNISLTFSKQEVYCKEMLAGRSKSADIGTKLEDSLKAQLSACHLNKVDNHPYWINRQNIQTHNNPDCRTMTFIGDDVHIHQIVPCSSVSFPFCEANKTLCQPSQKTNTDSSGWFSVAGQSSSYRLSKSTYPYCDAKEYCEKTWNSRLSGARNYTFKVSLAQTLGLTQQKKLDYWIESPYVSCPSGRGNASLVRYIGPFVPLTERRNANEDYKVLCETITPTVVTVSTTMPASSFPPVHSSMTSRPLRQMTPRPTSPVQPRTTSRPLRSMTPRPTTQKPGKTTIGKTSKTSLSSKRQRTPSSFPTLMPPVTQRPKITMTTRTNTLPLTTLFTTVASNLPLTSVTNLHTNATSPKTKRTRPVPNLHTNATSTKTKWTTTVPKDLHTNPTSSKTKRTTSVPNVLTNATSPKTKRTTPVRNVHTNATSPKTKRTTAVPNVHTNAPSPNTKRTTSVPNVHTNATSPKTKKTTSVPNVHTNATSPKTKRTTSVPNVHTNATSPKTKRTTSVPNVHTNATSPKTKRTTAVPNVHTNATSPNERSSTASPGPTWITVGREEYFVNYESMDYVTAAKFCHEKMNASLVMFLNPLRYFTILTQLALQNSSYWVGAHGMEKKLTDECLSYISNNMTLKTSSCHFEKFSVCSRILGGDVSSVLQDPEFKTLIREMTVLKNNTGKMLRKLTCAVDERPSARAVGSVGVFIMCTVVTILLLSDCSDIKSSFFDRKKKNQNEK